MLDNLFALTFFHVLFGLSLGLEPSASYSVHFFTQSLSSFLSTCPYHRDLFCCSINIISSIPSLSLDSLLGALSFVLTFYIHLTILILARWSATSFSFLTGQVSLLCSILLRTQLLYSPPLLINDISVLVSNCTNCLNLFHPIRILASTAASASGYLSGARCKWFAYGPADATATPHLFNNTTTTILRPFVRDYPGELVPEETLTHPPSWSSPPHLLLQ